MSKPLRITINVLIAFILLIALVIAILPNFQKEWVTGVPHIDMQPKRGILDKKDIEAGSAYDLLLQATNLYDKEVEPYEFISSEVYTRYTESSNISSSDFVLLQNALNSASNVMSLAIEASKIENPIISHEFDFHYLPLGNVRTLSNFFALEAFMHIKSNRFNLALNSWKNSMNFSNIISRGGFLINHLVLIATVAITTENIQFAATQGKMPLHISKDLDLYLKKYEKNLEPIGEAFKYEVLFAAREIENIYSDPVSFSQNLGMNEKLFIPAKALSYLMGSNASNTSKNFERLYSHLVKLSKMDYDIKEYDKIKKKFSKISGPLELILTKDPIGFILSNTTYVPYAKSIISHYQMQLNLRITRLYLAIDQYYQKHKIIPKSLNKLVPQFIDALPLDPFDGKELKYKTLNRGAWLIYSVGEDSLDQGGKYENEIDLEVRFPQSIQYGNDFIYISSPPSVPPIKIEEPEIHTPVKRGRRRR